jgi:hypothetical protein
MLFVNIALLRAEPQDVPASPRLLQGTLVLAGLSYLLAVSSLFPIGQSLLRAALDIGVMALFLYGVLMLRQYPARFLQSFTALCGTGSLLNLVAWPLFLMLAGGEPSTQTPGIPAAILLLWALYAWSLMVTGHIFRHSLDLSFPAGILVALLYIYLSYVSTDLIFPTPAASDG